MSGVEDLIGIVRSRDKEALRRIWDFFDRETYYTDYRNPYRELGAICSRGMIIKKTHNLIPVVRPDLGSGCFSWIFISRVSPSAFESVSVNYSNYTLSTITYKYPNNPAITIWEDIVYHEIVISEIDGGYNNI